MKTFRLARWGSQILPLTTRQPGLAARQPTHIYRPRWQSTVTVSAETEDGSLKRKRGRSPQNSFPTTTKTPLPSSFIPTTDSPIHTQAPPPPLPPKLQAAQNLDPRHSAVRLPTSTIDDGAIPQSSSPASVSPASPLKPQTELPAGTDIPTSFVKPPSPPYQLARQSAKLSALHSRLHLPLRFPLETLARTLVDKSADRNRNFNNHSFSVLGNELLGYYMGEYLLCQYPRLPLAVLHAALSAYVGPAALAQLSKEWGVEVAAEPGGEVNPGLLQFRRVLPGTPWDVPGAKQARDATFLPPRSSDSPPDPERLVTTLESASSTFVRSIFGALYMHCGAETTYSFFKSHVLSRRLDIASLFTFTMPTRDLSRLCAREGFESPVARVISETGRLSRVPVFVVGVFSGRDKLGEGAGSSLNEARFKAAVHALKGWYLYSPKGRIVGGETLVPSMMEGEMGKKRTWVPAHIDDGEVVV